MRFWDFIAPYCHRASKVCRYDCVTFPSAHANPTRSTRLPILSLHVRNGRIASPDDFLAEIQFVLLQEPWVVAAFRVPHPKC